MKLNQNKKLGIILCVLLKSTSILLREFRISLWEDRQACGGRGNQNGRGNKIRGWKRKKIWVQGESNSHFFWYDKTLDQILKKIKGETMRGNKVRGKRLMLCECFTFKWEGVKDLDQLYYPNKGHLTR